MAAPTPRFKLVEGSQSGHGCCFDATVVDTTKPVMIHGEHYEGRFEPVCECFDEEAAAAIVAALNAASRIATTPLDLLPPGPCNCEFTADPTDVAEDRLEKAWHYLRQCLSCGHRWFGLHCPHDGVQNPCPSCGVTPKPVTPSPNGVALLRGPF